MAREARKISPTGMYSVKLCGNELFKSGEDKTVFLEMLEKYFADGEVYGYDLAETEICLVVKESPKGISMTMKPLITSYARYFNRTHNLDGKLFAGRFRSEPLLSGDERDEAVKNLSKKTRSVKKSKPIRAVQPIQPKAEKKLEGKTAKKKKMPSYLL